MLNKYHITLLLQPLVLSYRSQWLGHCYFREEAESCVGYAVFCNIVFPFSVWEKEIWRKSVTPKLPDQEVIVWSGKGLSNHEVWIQKEKWNSSSILYFSFAYWVQKSQWGAKRCSQCWNWVPSHSLCWVPWPFRVDWEEVTVLRTL